MNIMFDFTHDDDGTIEKSTTEENMRFKHAISVILIYIIFFTNASGQVGKIVDENFLEKGFPAQVSKKDNGDILIGKFDTYAPARIDQAKTCQAIYSYFSEFYKKPPEDQYSEAMKKFAELLTVKNTSNMLFSDMNFFLKKSFGIQYKKSSFVMTSIKKYIDIGIPLVAKMKTSSSSRQFLMKRTQSERSQYSAEDWKKYLYKNKTDKFKKDDSDSLNVISGYNAISNEIFVYYFGKHPVWLSVEEFKNFTIDFYEPKKL